VRFAVRLQRGVAAALRLDSRRRLRREFAEDEHDARHERLKSSVATAQESAQVAVRGLSLLHVIPQRQRRQQRQH
jgi:hypothetical protein